MCDVPAGRAEDSVRGVSAPEPRAAPGGLPSVERRQVGAAGQRQASERGVRAGGEGPDPAGGHCCGGQVLFNALNPVHSVSVRDNPKTMTSQQEKTSQKIHSSS